MNAAPRVLVVTGEPSGDAHAARAVAALLERAPGAVIDAVGGVALAGAGARVRWGIEHLSARGFVEALGVIPRHIALYRSLARQFRRGDYDLVVLVDYPGFNLALARSATQAGVPVLYYVAPQLWAWGSWRVPRVQRDVTRLATILPFEAPFFSARGIPATFVGHPLLDRSRPDRATARRSLGLPAGSSALGLFPGSRVDEIRRHWPPFLAAGRLLQARHPGLRLVVAAVDGAAYPGADDCLIHRGDAALAFAAADAAVCKSGTTTLEAALADTPMVVAYRMGRGTYAVARRVVRIPHIGLVNILAQAAVAPELVQGDVRPTTIADAVDPLLDPAGSPARRQREALHVVRERLGTPGAAVRVAALALELVA